MLTKVKSYPLKKLIVLDAYGELDLAASRIALRKLAADPDFDWRTEVLLDMRDVECHMSTIDIHELASLLAWPDPALPTGRRIAVLVSGRTEFDHAKFLEMCASNRGITLAAFDDYDKADAWLSAELPADEKA